jgi:hypothetical protein
MFGGSKAAPRYLAELVVRPDCFCFSTIAATSAGSA